MVSSGCGVNLLISVKETTATLVESFQEEWTELKEDAKAAAETCKEMAQDFVADVQDETVEWKAEAEEFIADVQEEGHAGKCTGIFGSGCTTS